MALDIEFKVERHPGRWVALIIFIALIIASGWFGYKWYTTGELPFFLPVASANSGVNEASVPYDDVKNYTVADTHPRYISIPALKLSKTRMYPTKLDASNMVEAPTNIHDASWYDKSGTPGDGGVILVTGHNHGIHQNGAFAGLNTLVKGDKLTLERGDGESFTYSVVENQSMSLEEVNGGSMAKMGKSATPGLEALNIMTFDGKWVPRLSTFDHRIMLRAVIVDTK